MVKDLASQQTHQFSRTAQIVEIPDAGEIIVRPGKKVSKFLTSALRNGSAFLAKTIDSCPMVTDDGGCNESDSSDLDLGQLEWTDTSDDSFEENDDSSDADTADSGIGCSGGGAATLIDKVWIFAASNVCTSPGNQTLYISYKVPSTFTVSVKVTICVAAGSFYGCNYASTLSPGQTATATIYVPSGDEAEASLGYIKNNVQNEGVGWAYFNGCTC